MKLAVTGKGGVGKTTVTALLARRFAALGKRVLAVDADPNATLAACLGFPDANMITPLNEMADLIEERTGVRPGRQGAVFRMNPRVDDIPDRFAVEHDGVRVLQMGDIKLGGAGCYCPENAFLKSLVGHLMLTEQEVLIMDMEAGVEHLGRGTASSVDWLIMVLEPSRQSVATAERIQMLAADIGIGRVAAVGNKTRGKQDTEFLRAALDPIPLLGILPYDDGLRLAELNGQPPAAMLPETDRALTAIIAQLTQ